MPVVSKTDFVNTKFSVTNAAYVKLWDIDGFRQKGYVVNNSDTETIYIGSEAIKATLATNGAPLYPGQTYETFSISALYAVAAANPVDVRVMVETETEEKAFTTGTMNGCV